MLLAMVGTSYLGVGTRHLEVGTRHLEVGTRHLEVGTHLRLRCHGVLGGMRQFQFL